MSQATDVPFGWIVGGKWYGQCTDCGKIVRINKPIFGSLHVCLNDDERVQKHRARQEADFLLRNLK